MSPNTYIGLVNLGILGTVAFVATLLCAFDLRRLWAAARRGRWISPGVHFVMLTAVSLTVVQIAFNPPWPIDWNAPIPCQHDCDWAFYYVGIIAFLQAWAIPALLATTAMGIVLLRAVLEAEPFTKILGALGIQAEPNELAEPTDRIDAHPPTETR